MNKNGVLSTVLAALLAFTGVGYSNVKAENNNVKSQTEQLAILNEESVTPEDFPNIFNSYKTKNDNLEQYLEHVFLLEILRNGRPLMLPVRWSQNKVTPMFGTKHIGTLSQDLSEFILNDNFFAKDDMIRFIHIRSIESTLSYLGIDINDSRLSQLKECIYNDKPMKYSDLLNIFKMIIPKEMQPIKLEIPQVNTNHTIPKYTDEFLNKPFEIKKLTTIMIFEKNKPDIISIEFCEAIGEPTAVGSVTSLDLNNILTNEFELDTALYKKTNIVKRKGFNSVEYNYYFAPSLFDVLFYIGRQFPAMIEPLLAVKTYGDLLEVYQMLPLEVQRQYKEADFKDNPYLDNSSSLNRPKKLEKLIS